ncbi:MAG: rod shape-determining protein MreC [Methylotenera sp.]|nr:rod shape-determining protein MreC [Methylotenera sp.]
MVQGFHQNLEQQQAPAFFARGPSPFARLVFFAALSLTLIATDSRLQYLATVRENLMVLLHPLQLIANAPSQLYQFTNEYFSTHHRLLNENEQLKKQALKQDVALQQLNILTLENANLRDLLQTNKTLVESTALAEILHVGRDPFTKKIIVNRGSNHEVSAGAAVVDAAGVIGQVTRTYPSTSEVTLITDKSLAIPIQVERNGLRAIAFGHGRDNTLSLPYLPANVDIQRGDKLVTSGIDGVYPVGLAVATVTDIKVSPGSPFAQIVCEPTGGIEKHRQVLLVRTPQVDIVKNNLVPQASDKKNDAEKTQPQTLKEPKQQQNSSKPQPDNANKPHA